MGSKLAILAAQLSFVGIAAAQSPADLFKQGIDAYKAKRYDEAAALLERSYAAAPKAETLFALAQAERLGGRCDKAIPRYKQLLAETTELPVAKAVQLNLSMCPGADPPPQPAPAAKSPGGDDDDTAPAPPPPPRTIVREVRATDPLAVGLLAGGALGGGFAVGMLLRSSAARDDAGSARTLDDANALHDRADRDRLVAIIAGGASAVAIGFAVYRLASGGGETRATDVAVAPAPGGSMLVLSKRW